MTDDASSELLQVSLALGASATHAHTAATNILKRAGAEIREMWQASARQFPSPALSRAENYDISFDMKGTGGNTAVVTVGSADPLLAVIEYGSVHHAPQLHGSKALESALPGVMKALGWIGGVSGVKR